MINFLDTANKPLDDVVLFNSLVSEPVAEVDVLGLSG